MKSNKSVCLFITTAWVSGKCAGHRKVQIKSWIKKYGVHYTSHCVTDQFCSVLLCFHVKSKKKIFPTRWHYFNLGSHKTVTQKEDAVHSQHLNHFYFNRCDRCMLWRNTRPFVYILKVSEQHLCRSA